MTDRTATFDRVLALEAGRTALLVVDMRGFVEPGQAREGEAVIRKCWYDAFAGGDLDGVLRARGVTSLVMTGTMTDICVLATVVGAFNREYRITVVADAVSTLWPEIQRATLDIIGRAFGRVVSSKSVIDTLTTWR